MGRVIDQIEAVSIVIQATLNKNKGSKKIPTSRKTGLQKLIYT